MENTHIQKLISDENINEINNILCCADKELINGFLLESIKTNKQDIFITIHDNYCSSWITINFVIPKCISFGRIEMIKHLVETNYDEYAHIAFFHACWHNEIEIVRLLLNLGINPNCNRGDALIRVAYKEHVDILRLLLEHGADVHAQNNRLLIIAMETGNADMMRLLIQYGMNLNHLDKITFYEHEDEENDNNEKNEAQKAKEEQYEKISQMLISSGVDPEVIIKIFIKLISKIIRDNSCYHF